MNFSFVCAKLQMARERHIALEAIVLQLESVPDMRHKFILFFDEHVLVQGFTVDRKLWP